MANKIHSALLVAMLVTACTPLPEVDEASQRAQQHYDAVSQHVNSRDLTVGNAPMRSIRVDDGYWVSTDVEVVDQEMPTWFSTRRDSYVKGDALSLEQLGAYFRKQWNIKITRAPELVPRDQDDIESDVSLSASTNPALSGNSVSLEPNSNAGNDQGESDGVAAFIRTPKYRLQLRDVTPQEAMDAIAESLGIYWRYSKQDGVTFYYYDTKRFRIAKTGDGGSIELTITTQNNNTSSNGASQQSSLNGNLKIEPKFWENTKTTLESLASPYGRVLLNMSTGDVVVTDAPAGITRIDNYISELNQELGLKAHVTLSLVRLRYTNNRDFGYNLNVLYEKAQRASLAYETSRRAIEGASSVVGSIVEDSSRFNGSQFFLDALRSYGEVTVLRNKDFVLRNHSTYMLGKGRNIPYLESASNTNTPDVGATETAEIDEKFAGFGIGFYTRILNKDRAIFNVLMDLTDFSRFQNIQISSDQTSEVPILDSERHRQEYDLRDGQSQILLSLDLSDTNKTQDYVAGKDNCLAGCDESESSSREYLLYVMTMKVI